MRIKIVMLGVGLALVLAVGALFSGGTTYADVGNGNEAKGCSEFGKHHAAGTARSCGRDFNQCCGAIRRMERNIRESQNSQLFIRTMRESRDLGRASCPPLFVQKKSATQRAS
jgi:hypothetical protein